MGWLSRTVLKWGTSVQEREIKDFTTKLSYLDSTEVGFMLAVVADFRNHFLAAEGWDLHQPALVLLSTPTTTYQLSKAVKLLQRGGNPAPAAGIIVWVHTLRSMTEISLRPHGRALWAELQRGLPHVVESAQDYFAVTGKALDIAGFDVIPNGLGQQK